MTTTILSLLLDRLAVIEEGLTAVDQTFDRIHDNLTERSHP